MKTKKIEKFIYSGLGFPIQLAQVEMIWIDGEWHPKIDIRKISKEAMKALVSQEGRLTGNQIKFIRSYFSMTLREFAKRVVHESHTAVNKWEKFGDKVTNMDGNIEVVLRLYIYEQICMNAMKHKDKFYRKYQEVKQLFSFNQHPLLAQI